jgi:hypothetical protein
MERVCVAFSLMDARLRRKRSLMMGIDDADYFKIYFNEKVHRVSRKMLLLRAKRNVNVRTQSWSSARIAGVTQRC